MNLTVNEWYIYGNSTHGRFARVFPYVSAQVNEGGYDNALHPEKQYQSRRLRLKEYELKDHLGNVRAVVSDFKNKADTMTTNPPFNAEVLAVYNFYPFGMLQPGMFAENNAQRTRFGFNGMLRDDDVKDKLTTTTIDEGRGNSYATVGKFLETIAIPHANEEIYNAVQSGKKFNQYFKDKNGGK